MTLHLHRGSDEGLQAGTSTVYINIPILQNIEEDCREDRLTQILFAISLLVLVETLIVTPLCAGLSDTQK